MFHEIAGLPAHPLLVHAAVVLAPTLALVAIGHALVPAVRARSEWLLVVLAVAAPMSVAVARESGASLHRRLVRDEAVGPGLRDQVDAHAGSALTLLLLTLGLGAASLAWVLLKPRLQSPAPATALAVVTCTLGTLVLWWVVRTGHSGASMVWG